MTGAQHLRGLRTTGDPGCDSEWVCLRSWWDYWRSLTARSGRFHVGEHSHVKRRSSRLISEPENHLRHEARQITDDPLSLPPAPTPVNGTLVREKKKKNTVRFQLSCGHNGNIFDPRYLLLVLRDLRSVHALLYASCDWAAAKVRIKVAAHGLHLLPVDAFAQDLLDLVEREFYLVNYHYPFTQLEQKNQIKIQITYSLTHIFWYSAPRFLIPA